MHEAYIAKDIIREAEKQGDVRQVTIEVGELAHLPAEDLKKVLEKMTGWNIEVINKIADVMCDCGYVGRPHIIHKTHSSTVFFCPDCSSVPKVLKGNQIKLVEVRVRE